jgi:hypothetical protein
MHSALARRPPANARCPAPFVITSDIRKGRGRETKIPAIPKYPRGLNFQSGPGATRTRDLLLRRRAKPARAGASQRNLLVWGWLHADAGWPATVDAKVLGTRSALSYPEELVKSGCQQRPEQNSGCFGVLRAGRPC